MTKKKKTKGWCGGAHLWYIQPKKDGASSSSSSDSPPQQKQQQQHPQEEEDEIKTRIAAAAAAAHDPRRQLCLALAFFWICFPFLALYIYSHKVCEIEKLKELKSSAFLI